MLCSAMSCNAISCSCYDLSHYVMLGKAESGIAWISIPSDYTTRFPETTKQLLIL